jgi:hypothetical protein
MVNIKMVYHSPKWWKEFKELRKRNNLDQAISDEASTEATSVRPGPGLKPQASSAKQQATSTKPEPSSGSEVSSNKLQAPSPEFQAPSRK